MVGKWVILFIYQVKQGGIHMALITTEDTIKATGLTQEGLKKIRRVYRKYGRIQDFQLFDDQQVEEIKQVVAYKQLNTRMSYESAYLCVTQKDKQLEEKLVRMIEESGDESEKKVKEVFNEILGEKADELFRRLNSVTDYLKEIGEDDAQKMLISFQEVLVRAIVARELIKSR